MAELSEHDKAILNCVFNPNLPLEEAIEPNQPLEDIENDTPEVLKIRKLEVEAVQLAENGKLNEALHILNQALEINPNRASIYNNRALVHQFQRKFEDALVDLTAAIRLADYDKQKKTLAHALCQRGVLYRRVSKFDDARDDFQVAAKLGSQFAKSQLIELNPYAALCNQMLRKVMDSV